MAAHKSFAAAAVPFGKLAVDLGGKGLSSVQRDGATAAIKIAHRAAANDLGGDIKHSGWGVNLDVVAAPLKNGGVLIKPTRSSAGPWTVAERGRNIGESGKTLGPGISQKTGVTSRNKNGALRKIGTVKGKKWNGYTKPKNTASDAVAMFERDMPKVVDKAVFDLISKALS